MPQSQHVTLSEAIVNIRMRMSDPHQGTIGIIRYDRLTESIDEMKLIANEAAREVAVACCTPTTALLRSNNVRFQVISGKTEYGIQDDYLSVDYMQYIKNGIEFPIFPRDMRDFPPDKRERADTAQSSDLRYRYYDIYGIGAVEKQIGVVRQDSLNEIHDPFSTFDDIRIGDTVFNRSDGSQALVTNVVPGSKVLNENNETIIEPGYVVIDQLDGGYSNRFVQGDAYVISSKEDIAESLHLWPQIEFDDTNVKVYSGAALNWNVQEPFTMHGVDVYITEIPDNLEPDDRLIVEVLRDGELVTTDPPSVVSKVGIESGLNHFEFDAQVFTSGILIQEDTDYTIRASIKGTELTIDYITVYAFGTSDYISMSYSRLPAKMENDFDICEIPPYALGMYYTQAQIIATKKVTGAKSADPNLLAERELQKREIEDLLWNRTPRGVSYMSDRTDYRQRVQAIDGVDTTFFDDYI